MKDITRLRYMELELSLIRKDMEEQNYPLWPFKMVNGIDTDRPNSKGWMWASRYILDFENVLTIETKKSKVRSK